MAKVKGKNTQPEQFIRKALYRQGYRYRLHVKKMPGSPDLVLSKYGAVIFVHGCFWHGHDCHLFKWPQSRPDFWRTKIEKNRANDDKALDTLEAADWRVLVIWECALKGKEKRNPDEVIDAITGWLHSNEQYCEIRGRSSRASGKKRVQGDRRSRQN